METTFCVEWSVIVEAENSLDAAKQAWGMLDDATSRNAGASILFVSDEYGDNKEHYDMEYVGQCDDCNRAYITYYTSDHCTNCGNCLDHCICKFEMAGQL